MNKVAAYLQGHIQGRVLTRDDVRADYASDASAMALKSGIIAHPVSTTDIQSMLRFAHELAKKGHVLSITPRGKGSGTSGGALGKDVTLVLDELDDVYEYDAKQKLLRLQPGVSNQAVRAALRLHGTSIPVLEKNGTIGGAVASGHAVSAQKYGTIADWVDQLEVVLDDGTLLQTGRLSKRELGKKLGLPGREGDIYRGIETILEDHKEFIDNLRDGDSRDRSGYAGIADVAGKRGAFDLTPLFVGADGTLGVVAEMIVRTDYSPSEPALAAVLCTSFEDAQDIAEQADKLTPATLDAISGDYLAQASDQGYSFSWLTDRAVTATDTLLLVKFDDATERSRKRKLKKLEKIAAKFDAEFVSHLDPAGTAVPGMGDIVAYTQLPGGQANQSAPALIDGAYIPPEKLTTVRQALTALEKKLGLKLPLAGSLATHTFAIYSTLSMQTVTERQKFLRALDAVAKVIAESGGALVANGSEGRLHARFARAEWSDEYREINDKIKSLFDSRGILAQGVKADTELRDIAAQLRSSNF